MAMFLSFHVAKGELREPPKL